MNTLLALTLLALAVVSPSDAAPATTLAATATTLPAPVQAALDAIKADATAYAAAQANLAVANASLAAAQSQVAQLQAAVTTGQSKLVTDQAALSKALADSFGPQPTPSPIPIPVPPVVRHPITIIEIASTTCAPCNAMDSIIAELVAGGMAIKRIDADKDPAAAAPYAATATPTFIMQVDGQEVSRTVGQLQKSQLTGWHNATVDWVAKKYP